MLSSSMLSIWAGPGHGERGGEPSRGTTVHRRSRLASLAACVRRRLVHHQPGWLWRKRLGEDDAVDAPGPVARSPPLANARRHALRLARGGTPVSPAATGPRHDSFARSDLHGGGHWDVDAVAVAVDLPPVRRGAGAATADAACRVLVAFE